MLSPGRHRSSTELGTSSLPVDELIASTHRYSWSKKVAALIRKGPDHPPPARHPELAGRDLAGAGLQRHVVAGGLEVFDLAPDRLLGLAAAVVVAAKVPVVLAGGQDVPDRGDHRMLGGDQSPVVAAARADSFEPGGQERVLHPRG